MPKFKVQMEAIVEAEDNIKAIQIARNFSSHFTEELLAVFTCSEPLVDAETWVAINDKANRNVLCPHLSNWVTTAGY